MHPVPAPAPAPAHQHQHQHPPLPHSHTHLSLCACTQRVRGRRAHPDLCCPMVSRPVINGAASSRRTTRMVRRPRCGRRSTCSTRSAWSTHGGVGRIWRAVLRQSFRAATSRAWRSCGKCSAPPGHRAPARPPAPLSSLPRCDTAGAVLVRRPCAWFRLVSGKRPCADRALTVRWPCAGRALAVRWLCAGRALAVRWPCADRALTVR